MPTLRGYLPPLSSIILFLTGICGVLFVWKRPILAFWNGTRLEGDRSLPALVQTYLYGPFASYKLFFKAAYYNDRKDKRLAYVVEIFAGLVMVAIMLWEWVRRRQTLWAVITEENPLKQIAGVFFFVGFLTVAAVEGEAYLETSKRKRKEAEEEAEARRKEEEEWKTQRMLMNANGTVELTDTAAWKFGIVNDAEARKPGVLAGELPSDIDKVDKVKIVEGEGKKTI